MASPATVEKNGEVHWLPRYVVSFLTLTAGCVAPEANEQGANPKTKGDVLAANFLLSVFAVDGIAWGVGKSVQYEVIKLVEKLGSESPICYVVCALIISATEVVVEFFISALCPWFFAKWAEWRGVTANSSNNLIVFAAHAYCASMIVAIIAYPILGAFLYLDDKRNVFWVIMVFGGVRLFQYATLNQLGDAAVALAQTHWAASFQDLYLKLPGPFFRCDGLKRPATTTSLSLYLTIQRVFMMGIMGSAYIMLKGQTIFRWLMLLGLTVLSFLCSWSLAYWAEDLGRCLVDEKLIDLLDEEESTDEEEAFHGLDTDFRGSTKQSSTGHLSTKGASSQRLHLPSELLKDEKTYDSDDFVSPKGRQKLSSLNENATRSEEADQNEDHPPLPSNMPRGAEWGFIALLAIVEGVPGQAVDSLGAVIIVEVPGMIASGAAVVAVFLTIGFLAWRAKKLDPEMKPIGQLECMETKTEEGDQALTKRSANSIGVWMRYLGLFAICILIAGGGLFATSRTSGGLKTFFLFFVIVSMLPTGALNKGLDARLQEFLLGFDEYRSSILVYWANIFQVLLAAPLLAANWWVTSLAECGQDEDSTESKAASYVLVFCVIILLITTAWFTFCDRGVRKLVKETNTRVKKEDDGLPTLVFPRGSRLSLRPNRSAYSTKFPLRRAALTDQLSGQTTTRIQSRKILASRASDPSFSGLLPPSGKYGGGYTTTFSSSNRSLKTFPSQNLSSSDLTPVKVVERRGVPVRAGNSSHSQDEFISVTPNKGPGPSPKVVVALPPSPNPPPATAVEMTYESASRWEGGRRAKS